MRDKRLALVSLGRPVRVDIIDMRKVGFKSGCIRSIIR